MTSSPLISITNLIKDFGTHRVLEIPLLHFESGKIYALTGHNGSGKTTLLRIIAGLDDPTSGTVLVSIDKKRIGFCFQKPYMFRGTVTKNVAWALRSGCGKEVRDIAERLRIEDLLDHSAIKLSAGEMQKVSLARMLVCRPALLLLDEPIANLDAQGTGVIEDIIRRFVYEGGTCILATHMTGHASRLSAEVVRLEEGKIML